MKHLAVLLTCYNRKEKTLSCLEALFNCRLPDSYKLEVFLVDDGSTDGTGEAVKKQFKEVAVIKGEGNLYWNRGMHRAWVTAKKHFDYDYYLWLNDDTLLYEHALVELLDCEKYKDGKAIICGAIQSPTTSQFSYGGRDATGKALIPDGGLQTCHTINGNCVLVNKDICDIVGLLDPVFPHAIGDFEYGLRVVKKGFECVTTKTFIGECENNARLPKWCYGEVPLKERWKALYSPLGNSHPRYFFVFEYRHYGIVRAVKHFLSIHLRMLIPSLWK